VPATVKALNVVGKPGGVVIPVFEVPLRIGAKFNPVVIAAAGADNNVGTVVAATINPT
jgi:hypothetical protein